MQPTHPDCDYYCKNDPDEVCNLPGDCDGDVWLNSVECELGTDPCDRESKPEPNPADCPKDSVSIGISAGDIPLNAVFTQIAGYFGQEVSISGTADGEIWNEVDPNTGECGKWYKVSGGFAASWSGEFPCFSPIPVNKWVQLGIYLDPSITGSICLNITHSPTNMHSSGSGSIKGSLTLSGKAKFDPGEVVDVTVSVGGSVGASGEAEMSGLVITMSGTIGEVVASGEVKIELFNHEFLNIGISETLDSGFSTGEASLYIGDLIGI